MISVTSARCNIALALSLSVLTAGCATTYKPEDLRIPSQITCINLATPLSVIVGGVREVRLERGPYVSIREDAEGTYYEGSPGGLSFTRLDGKPTLIEGDQHISHSGGIWIPRDQNTSPRLYNYFTADYPFTHTPAEPPPPEADCASSVYVKDPATAKISVLRMAAAGAVGGVLGRAIVPNSQLGYGQSAVAGAIVGVIGATIINADLGKIYPVKPPDDAQFIARLKELGRQAVPLKQAQIPAPSAISANPAVTQ